MGGGEKKEQSQHTETKTQRGRHAAEGVKGTGGERPINPDKIGSRVGGGSGGAVEKDRDKDRETQRSGQTKKEGISPTQAVPLRFQGSASTSAQAAASGGLTRPHPPDQPHLLLLSQALSLPGSEGDSGWWWQA